MLFQAFPYFPDNQPEMYSMYVVNTSVMTPPCPLHSSTLPLLYPPSPVPLLPLYPLPCPPPPPIPPPLSPSSPYTPPLSPSSPYTPPMSPSSPLPCIPSLSSLPLQFPILHYVPTCQAPPPPVRWCLAGYRGKDLLRVSCLTC